MVGAWFAAIGCDVENVFNKEEAKEVLFALKKAKQDDSQENSKQKYAIIFILEEFIKDISDDDYKKLSSWALPAIIPLPSHKGSTGYGEMKIRKIVEKAIGSDIFN